VPQRHIPRWFAGAWKKPRARLVGHDCASTGIRGALRMVSTYLSFDLINRDMASSLKRISSQTQVTNDQAYYQENIGKVKSVDEFLDNYRLYNFAMTAYGLGDMAYAKAFMKQVLESDLSDTSSFANRLTDERYTNFAAAFNFGVSSSTTAVAQSEGQMEDVFDLYNAQITALEDKTAEDTRYFKVMMGTAGNVTNVDQFLRNDELRNYIFNAYGIDGQYYNYTAVRGALTSDPNDPDSYYSKTYGAQLDSYNAAKTEDAALKERVDAKSAIATYQSSIEIGGEQKTSYEQQIASKRQEMNSGGDQAALQAEIDALQAKLDTTNELIAQDQAALDAKQARYDELDAQLVPIEETDARRAELAKVIAGYSSSSMTFYGQMKKLAEDFQFNADGTVPATGALSDDKIKEIVGNYFSAQGRVTRAEALFNQEYFDSKISTVTNVDDLLDDPRTYAYLRGAFNLDEAYIVKSTLEQILISDLSDPTSVANSYPDRPGYLELAKAFNFNTDGTVKDGGVQTTAQATTTRNNYMSRWDDKQEEDLDKSIGFYKSDMASIESLDDFLSADAKTTYEFALTSVGIDPDSVSKFKIRSILQSDLSDPNSYVYQLKDERFVSLAKLFNFDKDGDVTVPVLAQSNATITNVAKDYILRQTRFLEGDELKAAKTKAEEDAKYYTDAMQRIDNRDQFLADRQLINIVLTSEGIDPETVTDDFIKQIFSSDLDDPESYVNKLDDKRFAQIVGSFNFDADGEIDRSLGGTVQNGGQTAATQSMYLSQLLETEQGNDNAGVRLALYFQRLADSITDPYVILGDDALAEFFRVTFSLPEEFSNMDIDKQAAVVEKNLNLEDLSDPVKLKKLVERFTFMYDIENNSGSSSPAVSILNGSSGSAGISADTLWALAQLGAG
jgi:hypothetical protein